MVLYRARTNHVIGVWLAHAVCWFLVATFVTSLGACVTRPGPGVLQPARTERVGRKVPVFVATLRAPEPGSGTTFGGRRSPTLHFARYVISIPPAHRTDVIEWPSDPPDPATDFVTVDAARLSEAEFRSGIASAVSDGSSIRLFVHGYNNSFQETVYRLAQITTDAHDNRVAVLFAWPSQGRPLSYSADRAAAAASTDGLARTIEILAERRRERVVLLAHSMGGWLAMETLTKMSRERRRAVFERFSNVVLAAPDIDIADMVRQLEIVGRLPRPLTLLVSSDDSALTLSRIITGGRRVGADDVHDPWVQAAAKRYGARVIDISELTTSDTFKHARFTAMVALYSKFQAQIENPLGKRYAGPGAFVFRAATSTLEPVDR
ncbi:alpha/beta hydrolase [Microvirga zambiensis]|uniref:alpha/beta hydrolase n=1 Tax=Microvirga zambiensis TaxID=1402137 RepID=UPI00191F0C35|nr:alpha/beta fold hydrolase [Microvirga zambiensis]